MELETDRILLRRWKESDVEVLFKYDTREIQSMDNQLIAFCGLDCGECEARKATLTNDDGLRKEVSKKWCEMNHTDQITPETINCLGCRTGGIKFAYCDFMCPIRKCALSKGIDTCADCQKKSTCEKLAPFLENETAKSNLKVD